MSNFFTVMVQTEPRRITNLAYGLTILLDLADSFYKQPGYLHHISEKHGLPLAVLEPIARQMECAGLLERHPEDENGLMLKGAPEGRWILDVIPHLKKALKMERPHPMNDNDN